MNSRTIRSLTLRWLSRQTESMIGVMREYYSDELQVPIIETNETFQSTEEIEWVWGKFSREICELSQVAYPPFSVTVTQSL